MEREPLNGTRILVVEDDFLLAWNEREMLEEAGAEVIGPCSDEESAFLLASDGRVDCAVLDLNLGTGPSFKLAQALRARDIPLVLVSGYDPAVFPDEMSDVKRLQKPFDNKELLRIICNLCNRHAFY